MITVVSKTQTIMVMILILQMMTAKMISESDAIKMIVITVGADSGIWLQ